ncbi:hypothetical protein [Actinotalea solisilvae]|uniref:hypothetical protein n=1 Tax=Actinotalea solisilvae TaxID=2072922 RepID=UPI0018F16238|nr:hypothetical protein [Actinotalea solisilvae]
MTADVGGDERRRRADDAPPRGADDAALDRGARAGDDHAVLGAGAGVGADAVPLDPTPGGGDDDVPLDPAAGAAILAEQRARVRSATDVDGRVLFGAWGVAWVLGFGALWLAASRDDPPFSYGVALVVFAALLVAAMAVTGWHLAARTAGVHGASAVQGAMYGWTWFVAFAGIFALSVALGRAGASPAVVTTVMTLVPALVVGAMYMAGGAIWGDRPQFVLGAVIGVVTVVAAFVGLPHMLGVMAAVGGGGMLAAAGVVHVRRRAVRARGALGLAGGGGGG